MVDLIDVTLACEDANSTLVTVDAEKRVDNILVRSGDWNFVVKIIFVQTAQGLVEILKLKFRQNFEAGFCSAFCR